MEDNFLKTKKELKKYSESIGKEQDEDWSVKFNNFKEDDYKKWIKNRIKNECKHNFRYSHIEYPPAGTYSHIPKDKEVVVCTKCGLIIKTDKI